MNKIRLLAGLGAGILLLAAVAGALLLRQLQTNQQIDLRPMTQQMRESPMPLTALELLQTPLKKNWYSDDGLYSLTYYPEVSTAAVSFYLQKSSSLPTFYLVDTAGETYDGWYIPSQTQSGVYKVFFEDLPADIKFQKLLCVCTPSAKNSTCEEFLLT